MFGPSEGALSGSGCVSIKTAATPTATAALARYSTNSLCPPLFSPSPPVLNALHQKQRDNHSLT